MRWRLTVWKRPASGKLESTSKVEAVLTISSSNDLAYYQFNKEGKKIDECWIKTPAVTWTHEMAITDKLVYFFLDSLLQGRLKSLCVLTVAPSYVIFVMTSHEIDLEHMKKEAGTHFRRNAFLVRNLIVPCL